jgi:site-specific recombinase XerC
MSGDDYQRVIDNSSVKGEILPAGRKLGRGEIMDLMRDCEIDPTKAGVRDTVIIALVYSCGLQRAGIVALDFDDKDIEIGRILDCLYQI